MSYHNNSKIPSTGVIKDVENTAEMNIKASPPNRTCKFQRDEHGYGFKITGNAPVKVHGVRKDSAAWNAGLRENDLIVKINGVKVTDKMHREVVALIRKNSEVDITVRGTSQPNSPSSHIPVSRTHPQKSPTIQPMKDNNKKPTQHFVKHPPPIPPSLTNTSTSLPVMKSSLKDPAIHSSHYRGIGNNSNDVFKRPMAPAQARPNSISNFPKKVLKLDKQDNVPHSTKINVTSSFSSDNEDEHNENRNGNEDSDDEEDDEDDTSISTSSETSSSSARNLKQTKPRRNNTNLDKMKIKSSVLISINSNNKNESNNSDVIEGIKVENTSLNNEFASNTTKLSSHQSTPIKSHSYSTPKVTQYNPEIDQSCSANASFTAKSDVVSPQTVSATFMKPSYEFMDSPVLKRNQMYCTMPRKAGGQFEMGNLRKADSLGQCSVRFMGRSYDNDSEDKDDDEREDVQQLMEMMSSVEKVLNNPDLMADLLCIAKDQPTDLHYIMFYYACKYFDYQYSKDEDLKISKRMATEIITTFLEPNSPLKLSISEDILDNISSILTKQETIKHIFWKASNFVMSRIQKFLSNIGGRIQTGTLPITSFKCLRTKETNEHRLSHLFKTFNTIVGKQTKETSLDEYNRAIKIVYSTLYSYHFDSFQRLNKDQSLRYKTRSFDSLNFINSKQTQSISEYYKISNLCNVDLLKNFLIGKRKSKNASGHSLKEEWILEPEICCICDKLLWGPGPQGYCCANCSNVYHHDCRKKIRSNCIKKIKKSTSQVSLRDGDHRSSATISNTPSIVSTPSGIFSRLSRKSSNLSMRNNSLSQHEDNQVNGTSYNSMPISISSTTNNSNNGNTNNNNSTDISELERLNSLPSGENESEMQKSHSEDMLNRSKSILSINSTGSMIRPSVEESMGDNVIGTSTGPIISPSSISNVAPGVLVKDLIQDESEYDPDMLVDESFDAGMEMETIFPEMTENADRKRIIVLLEFYHKSRYILMNMKKLMYKLVNNWPESQKYYFRALGLDSVKPFVELIKSFVTAIEKQVNKDDFVKLEDAVYEWLSERDDANLKEWMTLSSTLVCTNSLNIVKQLKATTIRTIPELQKIVTMKLNKSLVLDELNQIRPLLISLPLIVKNIIKCLSKSEDIYPVELEKWRMISIKMDYLCEYIDRCCVPLVDWINNGSISKFKFEFPQKFKDSNDYSFDYCSDFPRTLFFYQIFDFQVAKIFQWSTSSKKSKAASDSQQTFYLKKGADVLLIFYRDFIAVLLKENEHYVLKPIKSQKGIDRQLPILSLGEFAISKGGQEDDYSIINIFMNTKKTALLIRIGLQHVEVAENWIDFINNKKHNLERSMQLYKLNDVPKTVTRSISLKSTADTDDSTLPSMGSIGGSSGCGSTQVGTVDEDSTTPASNTIVSENSVDLVANENNPLSGDTKETLNEIANHNNESSLSFDGDSISFKMDQISQELRELENEWSDQSSVEAQDKLSTQNHQTGFLLYKTSQILLTMAAKCLKNNVVSVDLNSMNQASEHLIKVIQCISNQQQRQQDLIVKQNSIVSNHVSLENDHEPIIEVDKVTNQYSIDNGYGEPSDTYRPNVELTDQVKEIVDDIISNSMTQLNRGESVFENNDEDDEDFDTSLLPPPPISMLTAITTSLASPAPCEYETYKTTYKYVPTTSLVPADDDVVMKVTHPPNCKLSSTTNSPVHYSVMPYNISNNSFEENDTIVISRAQIRLSTTSVSSLSNNQ